MKRRLRRYALAAAAGVAIGALPTNALADRLRIYEHENYVGTGRVFSNAERNLASRGLSTNISSAKVVTGRWLLCEEPFFGGSCAWISRDVPSLRALGLSGTIESLRPEAVPVIRRQWGKRRPPARADLVFFPEQNFQGEWTALERSVPDLAGEKIPIRPASVIVQSGAWRVCSRPNFSGKCLALTASAWDLHSLFAVDIMSAEKLD